MIETLYMLLFVILMINFLLIIISVAYYLIKGKEFIKGLTIKLYFPILIICENTGFIWMEKKLL